MRSSSSGMSYLVNDPTTLQIPSLLEMREKYTLGPFATFYYAECKLKWT